MNRIIATSLVDLYPEGGDYDTYASDLAAEEMGHIVENPFFGEPYPGAYEPFIG